MAGAGEAAGTASLAQGAGSVKRAPVEVAAAADSRGRVQDVRVQAAHP